MSDLSAKNRIKKILYLEDDEMVRESILAFLMDEGYEVYGVENGIDGLEKFFELNPAVVLSDLRIPGIDGLEVLTRIKEKSPHTPVIIISGTKKEEDLVECINRGAFRYFSKPANLFEIGAEVKSALELSELRLRDKTHREKLEELVKERTQQLRESEERYRNILKSIEEGYSEIDINGSFTFFNDSMHHILGYSKEEMMGLNFREYMDNKNAQKVFKTFKKVYETGEPEKGMDYEIFRKDGTKSFVETSISLIKDTQEEISGYRCVLRDITIRKMAEETLKKAHDDLENRVKQRTAELAKTNQILQQEINERQRTAEELLFAKKQAEEANNAKSEFLANISHELRTPMHGILSYSRFGIDKIDSVPKEKQLHYFNQINKSGNRLLILLNDLLDLSRLESGKMVSNMKVEDVRHIVDAGVREFDSALKDKRLSLKVDEPKISIRVECDSFNIGQVIRNLISNAIKFSASEKTISIGFEPGQLNRGTRGSKQGSIPALTVKVVDEGIGIPENELESIFDKFIQSSKTKTGAGGTGLGLAICFEIIKLHKGKIWAEQNPSGGTIFSFMLPYQQL